NEDKQHVSNVMFAMSENQKLLLDVRLLNTQTLNYLHHQIIRNRFDLRSHTQRILLCVKLCDSDALFGAILDLYIVLGKKGYSLRYRMLSISEPQLSPKQRVFLDESLGSGLSADDVVPFSNCSALSLGYTGIRGMVKVISKKKHVLIEIDPIKLADDYIECGQVDAARELLEATMLAQPWRQEVHKDLLSLYKATRDSVRSEIMYKKLDDATIPNPSLWRDTLQFIRQTAGDN
ncbi:MAG: FimV family protein, partial [Thiohalomonadales bacterium]